MIYLEWIKVYKLVGKYGYEGPCLDVGGYLQTTMADYNNDAGLDSHSIACVGPHIWCGFADEVEVSHDIEESANQGLRYGTIVSTSTLEHVEDPRNFFRDVNKLLKPGGLAVISTVFMWPEHGDPGTDFWRFTPSGLRLLAVHAGLHVLDSGFIEIGTQRTVSWIAASNGELSVRDRCSSLPKLIAG